MKTNKSHKDLNKLIEEKNQIIAQKDIQIEDLLEKLGTVNNSIVAQELESTKQEVKKNKKFDVKIWLLTSSFAICSCIFGLTNLILNLVKK